MTLDLQNVAQIAASRGLNTIFEGLAVAGLSWAALKYVGVRNSMARFAVWFSTLIVIASLPLMSTTGSDGTGLSSHLPGLQLSSSWAVNLFLAWATIATFLLLRLGISLWHVAKLRRQCTEVDLEWQPEFLDWLQKFPHRGQIRILLSEAVRLPAAIGFFRPAIVLPSWTLRELSADELKVIVLHELAHLRRWDDWTNLAQKLVKALFFFHPAVWWIDSRLALEREVACDDMVLAHTQNAAGYASSLISLAERAISDKSRGGRALLLAQTVLGRVRELSQRLAQILDTKRPRTNLGWKPAASMIAVMAVITVGAAPYAPEIVSFEKKTPGTLLSAGAEVLPSVAATPVSLRLSQEQKHRSVPPENIKGKTVHTAPSAISGNPAVVPVKATSRKPKTSPNVMMTKAQENTSRAATLLIIRSTQLGGDGVPVWTLSVWRVTSENGQAVQQMFVMNSI